MWLCFYCLPYLLPLGERPFSKLGVLLGLASRTKQQKEGGKLEGEDLWDSQKMGPEGQ